ncbi:hypothetical protein RI103_19485 [Paraburkholderia sp. FT54]|uniref:hypothetical protein n=1 Tax=Paraburkholderia sp. FT54 TaxID=3074437 RepID=UPI0028777212|nr:hypothetical protein [Paraburkholderia sp. FT54]WNC93027.1 hypothetical protein RI103_19485 [Paraburkholderia sp. FT54]
MNLHEQLGALEMGVDQLIQAVVAPQAEHIPETPAENAAPQASADQIASASTAEAAETEAAVVKDKAPAPQLQPTLEINRPAQNEITMTIGGQTVALRAEQIGQLIEELSNARASMTPEPPPGIPPGWRFVSTKNPVMAVQKQSNGDRLLVMRHTGHGWVPFTFSPDMVIQLYMMLTKG